jgi:hypothetical protein
MAELTLEQLLGSGGIGEAAGMLQEAEPRERRAVLGEAFKQITPFISPPGVMEAIEGRDMTMRDIMLLGVLGPLGGKGKKGLRLIQGGRKEGRTFGDEALHQQGRSTFKKTGAIGPREEFEGVFDLVIKHPDLQAVVEPSGLTYVFKKGKNPDAVFDRPLSEALGTISPDGRPDDDLRKILTEVLRRKRIPAKPPRDAEEIVSKLATAVKFDVSEARKRTADKLANMLIKHSTQGKAKRGAALKYLSGDLSFDDFLTLIE